MLDRPDGGGEVPRRPETPLTQNQEAARIGGLGDGQKASTWGATESAEKFARIQAENRRREAEALTKVRAKAEKLKAA